MVQQFVAADMLVIPNAILSTSLPGIPSTTETGIGPFDVLFVHRDERLVSGGINHLGKIIGSLACPRRYANSLHPCENLSKSLLLELSSSSAGRWNGISFSIEDCFQDARMLYRVSNDAESETNGRAIVEERARMGNDFSTQLSSSSLNSTTKSKFSLSGVEITDSCLIF